MAIPDRAEEALAAARGRSATAAEIDRLGRAVGPEAARWAFSQWALRERARIKFARADEMLFDRDGLEMATHERVAAYHASQFAPGVPVVDTTCGLGADLIALAARGPAIGYDRDPERAALARHNVLAHGLSAEVRVGDGTEAIRPGASVFLDPARRTEGRRARGLADYVPDPAALRPRLQACARAVIKLSPLLPDADLEAFGGRVEFLSHRGECPEALVVLPGEGRAAVHVETGAVCAASPLLDRVDEPAEYLYEADPAAIRAHALGGFGIAGLGDSNGYLTSDRAQDSVWLHGFRVLWHGAFRPEAVRQALAALDGRVAAVKVRGVRADPVRVERELRTSGSRALVLVLYPVGAKVRAAVTERLVAG